MNLDELYFQCRCLLSYPQVIKALTALEMVQTSLELDCIQTGTRDCQAAAERLTVILKRLQEIKNGTPTASA